VADAVQGTRSVFIYATLVEEGHAPDEFSRTLVEEGHAPEEFSGTLVEEGHTPEEFSGTLVEEGLTLVEFYRCVAFGVEVPAAPREKTEFPLNKLTCAPFVGSGGQFRPTTDREGSSMSTTGSTKKNSTKVRTSSTRQKARVIALAVSETRYQRANP
jgi:hypothetical protein